jgi:hypothetical protein
LPASFSPPPVSLQPIDDSWVELSLTDKAGKPVPAAAFRFVGADGATREGKLDGRGFIRLDKIARGPGKASFPEHAPEERQVPDREKTEVPANAKVAIALEALDKRRSGKLVLHGDGYKKSHDAGESVIFEEVSANRRYSVDVEPKRGPKYVLRAPFTLSSKQLVQGQPPKAAIQGVVATLCYADDPQKPLDRKHVQIDVGEKGGWVAARTDARGRLCSVGGSRRRAARSALARPDAHELPRRLLGYAGASGPRADGHPHETRREDARQERQESRWGRARAPGKRLRAQLPVSLTFPTAEHANAWLRRNTMRVDIDGEPVPCGAFVSSAEVIVVEFNLPPESTRSACPASRPTPTARCRRAASSTSRASSR